MESYMISNIALCIVVLVLAYNNYRTIKTMHEERKDLLNRIMAKDLNDYKNVNNTSLPKGMSPLRKKEPDFEGLYE